MATTVAAAQLNILDPAFDHDGPELAQAREANWYATTPLGPMVLRHAEAWNVLRDRRYVPGGYRYMDAVGITEGPVREWFVDMLASKDGDDHQRLRGMVNRAFTPRVVESLRSYIGALAGSVADRIADGPEVCDFVDTFAEPVAGLVMCRMFGIPDKHYDRMHRWVADMGLVFDTRNELARSEAAVVGLSDYVSSLIDERRLALGDDLLSSMITAEQEGDRLTEAELHNLTLLLVWAGQDTTARQLGRAAVVFSEHPEQWDLLADRPELAPQAVEELCRWSPQARFTFRFATEDIDYGDLHVAAGTMVMVSIVAGNRDPRAYKDADRFDITVERKARQLVFGGGIHVCLGMNVARLELAEALVALAQRLAAPSVAGPIRWSPPTAMIHGPLSLPVRFKTRD